MSDIIDIISFDEQVRNLLAVLLPNNLEQYEEMVSKLLQDYNNLPRKIQFISGQKFIKEREIIIQNYFRRALLFTTMIPEGKQLSKIIYDYFSDNNKTISSPNCENCSSSNIQYMSEIDKLVCLNCGLEKNEDTFQEHKKINNYNRFNNVTKMVNDFTFINSSQKSILLKQYNLLQQEYNRLNQDERGNRKNFFRAPFILKFLCQKNNYPLFGSGDNEITNELINCEIKDAQLEMRCRELLEKLYKKLFNKDVISQEH